MTMTVHRNSLPGGELVGFAGNMGFKGEQYGKIVYWIDLGGAKQATAHPG
jgi:hypothetical protein